MVSRMISLGECALQRQDLMISRRLFLLVAIFSKAVNPYGGGSHTEAQLKTKEKNSSSSSVVLEEKQREEALVVYIAVSGCTTFISM